MKYRLPSSVKGVNFYGPKSEFIVSGSDCSNVFLWEAQSEEVINYFHSDNTGLVSGRTDRRSRHQLQHAASFRVFFVVFLSDMNGVGVWFFCSCAVTGVIYTL